MFLNQGYGVEGSKTGLSKGGVLQNLDLEGD